METRLSNNGKSRFDVVVVGGRCAGSVLGLRLARAGARVAMVDRDELGSDTLSTHTIFPNTISRLEGLGVLAPLIERHDVPSLRYRIRVLGHEFAGGFSPIGGFDRAIAPRRVALDRVLAEAALDAGVQGRFGEKVAGLIGSGEADDPVRGVTLASGETIEADWTVGADGRSSTVAAKLGLERTRTRSSDLSMLLSYWRGLPETDMVSFDIHERHGLTLIPCEDGLQALLTSGPPDHTRGGPAARERAYLSALREFPTTLDPEAIDQAERITPVRSAPETMLRGFFRRPSGPGWALIGDAGHFKHPATAQGISDAVEHAIYVSDALMGGDASLDDYEAWRDERAAGHYEFSFQFGMQPQPEVAGPIFAGIASEPETAQDFRDAMSRLVRPDRRVFSRENLGRWLAAAPAKPKTVASTPT
ncbi:MAG TPA: NAD(P)/FAD-dependent oxidoreductase [Thermoleophilaceae bacterium]|nr:NAD(P)/FAD-dependent oxidoreductase [Thermoleophilaceae bacterium]